MDLEQIESLLKLLAAHDVSSFSYRDGTWVTEEDPAMENAIISGVTHDTSEAKVTIEQVPDRPPGLGRDRLVALVRPPRGGETRDQGEGDEAQRQSHLFPRAHRASASIWLDRGSSRPIVISSSATDRPYSASRPYSSRSYSFTVICASTSVMKSTAPTR